MGITAAAYAQAQHVTFVPVPHSPVWLRREMVEPKPHIDDGGMWGGGPIDFYDFKNGLDLDGNGVVDGLDGYTADPGPTDITIAVYIDDNT